MAAPSMADITGTETLDMSSKTLLILETNGPTSSSCILALSFKSAPEIKNAYLISKNAIGHLISNYST
jgi:hypothetical protein